MIKELLNNSVFVALIGAGAVGSITWLARGSFGWTYNKVKRTFTSSVQVNSEDAQDLFKELAKFVFSLKTFSKIKTLNIFEQRSYYMGNDENVKFALTPSPGIYWGLEGMRPIFVEMSQERNENGGVTATLTFGCFSFDNSFLKGLVEKMMNKIQNSHLVQISNGDSSFTRQKRDMDLVYLENGLVDKIKNDITVFFNSEAEYRKFGHPWCYKVLLTGPPGTGKSSLLFAIASTYDLKMRIIPNDVSESYIRSYITMAPPRTLLAWEDIDVASVSINREDEKKITLSTLLNLLDSTITPEGCVFVITTNHPEKLDPAISRPGRMDSVYHLDHYSRQFAENLSQKLLGRELPAEFNNQETISPAALLTSISKTKQ